MTQRDLSPLAKDGKHFFWRIFDPILSPCLAKFNMLYRVWGAGNGRNPPSVWAWYLRGGIQSPQLQERLDIHGAQSKCSLGAGEQRVSILAETHLELCPLDLAEEEQSSVFDSNLSTWPGRPFDKVTMFSEEYARLVCKGTSVLTYLSPVPRHHHYKEDNRVLWVLDTELIGSAQH